MKTAIIGLGIIGSVHKDILQREGYDLCAVCDVDENKLNGSPINTYVDYKEMLEKEKPDVVHICTPHHLHAEMVIEALNRGINVLCEKPLCIKEEDIERILQAEKASVAKLGVCHQNRYNPENVFVKEYLNGKTIVGGTGSVVWNRDGAYYGSAEWRGKWETEGGGVLINQALHTLDLMQWLIGYPEKVEATLSNQRLKNVIEVEDTASLRCFGGGNFTFYATNGGICDFPVSIKIKTDKEVIDVLNGKVVTNNAVYDFEKDKKVYGKCCYGTGHVGLFNDYYQAIEKGESFWIDGAEASKVLKIIFSAYKNVVV